MRTCIHTYLSLTGSSFNAFTPPIAGGGSSNGLSEDQLASSLATLQSLAVACEGDLRELRRKPAEVGTTAECLVRRIVGENDFLEVRSEKPTSGWVRCGFICCFS